MDNTYEKRWNETVIDITITENRNYLQEWLTDLSFDNVSEQRRIKLMRQIAKLHTVNAITKPISEYTAKDVKHTVMTIRGMSQYTHKSRNRVMKKTYSEHTKTDFIRALQQWFRWFEQHDKRFDNAQTLREAKEVYSTIRSIKKKPQIQDRNREAILTVEDFGLIVHNENNLLYKALYSLLFYNGLRIGTHKGGVLHIKIKDIRMNDTVWDIVVDDKTGVGTVFVLEPRPYITKFLREYHPDPKNPEAYLFTSPNRNKPVTYAMVRSRLLKIRKRIQKTHPEWNKTVKPHWFRHSWATLNVNKMPDALFKRQGKWKPNSTVPSVYNHSNNDDYRNKFEDYKGVVRENEPEREMWVCHVCKLENTPDMDLCECGTPANFGIYAKQREEFELEKKKTLQWLFDEVMNDPTKRKQLMAMNSGMEQRKT